MKISGETVKEMDDVQEKDDMKKVEAVLFISGRFLNMQEIISYTDLNPMVVREVIEKLQEKYNGESSALKIISKNEMWKMDVAPDYADLINRLATGRSEFAKAEQETLAIIAFKQPIKQSVVIKIRGNKAYDHVKKFFELGLIKKKRQGHTHELSLSEEFHDYFNVGSREKEAGVENEEGEKEEQ